MSDPYDTLNTGRAVHSAGDRVAISKDGESIYEGDGDPIYTDRWTHDEKLQFAIKMIARWQRFAAWPDGVCEAKE